GNLRDSRGRPLDMIVSGPRLGPTPDWEIAQAAVRASPHICATGGPRREKTPEARPRRAEQSRGFGPAPVPAFSSLGRPPPVDISVCAACSRFADGGVRAPAAV